MTRHITSSRASVIMSMDFSTENAVTPTMMPMIALNIHLIRPRFLLFLMKGRSLLGLSCIRRSSMDTTLISTSVSSDSASFMSSAQLALRSGSMPTEPP
jgi:hypothetical protein